MNLSNITSVPEPALEHLSGFSATESDFISNYPVAIYVLLTMAVIGTLLNVYLVSINKGLF